MLLLLMAWVVFSSWLLFLAPFETMFAVLIILVLGAMLAFYWIFSRLVIYSGWLSRRNAILLVCFVSLLLTLFPPFYSWYSSVQQLDKMFAALGVQATRIDIEIQMFDSIGDVREHMKSVVGTYQLAMPVDEAEKRLVSALRPLPDWTVVTDPDSSDFVMYADCDRHAGGPVIDISLQTNGTLILGIPRFAPDYCYLK